MSNFQYLFEKVEPYVYPIEEYRNEFLNALKYHLCSEKKINVTVRKYQKIYPEKMYISPGIKLLSIGSNDLKVYFEYFLNSKHLLITL